MSDDTNRTPDNNPCQVKKSCFLSNPNNNPWKDDQGRWLTAPLFWERRNPAFTPRYTLHEDDVVRNGVTYRSLRKIYLNYDHVPGYEYDFSQEYLGGWNHWNRLLNSILKEEIKEWRMELEIKQKAQGIKKIIQATTDPGAVGFNANKYLVDKGYLDKETKGRPKKEDIAREAKIAAEADKALEDDLNRLRLVK